LVYLILSQRFHKESYQSRDNKHINSSTDYNLVNYYLYCDIIESLDSYVSVFLFPTLIPPSGVGTTCFSSCYDKESIQFNSMLYWYQGAIVFTIGRLPDVNPPWKWRGTNDCKCSRVQRHNVPSEARRRSR
jgi:hypothetical protein